MPKTLVIVESPAKARTIERILEGRVRGARRATATSAILPESADEIPDEIRKKKWGRLGVDTDGDFKPYYVIPNDKRKNVQALKAALKGASEVMLATDPDREGESISWHLKEVLKPKVPVKRIVFHEITEDAINEGRERRARRGRQPGARAGEPPHSRSALRLHAVAGALEEGADGPERRPRAERRRPADRRSRRRAPGVFAARPTGISKRGSRARAASSRRRSRASATSASPAARTSTRRAC